MSRRPLDDHQREWLSTELNFWRERQLVDAATAERILAEYESTGETGNRKRSIARLALMGVAAAFVGLAVLLVVGYNWSELSSNVKLVAIFGGVLSANLLAYYLRFVAQRRGLSEVVFLLAAIFYGAGIALVADVFHLRGHPPDALWWWALGVIPIAIILETPLVHVLIVALLATWTGLEIFEYRHRHWWFWQAVPNAALSLPLLAIPGIAWAYRRSSTLALGLYLALIAWWIVLQSVAWGHERYTVLIVGIMGPLYFILAENHRIGSRLAVPYRFWGVLLTGGALIPLSYLSFHRYWWWWGTRYESEHELIAIFAVAIVWVVTIAACGTLFKPLGEASDESSFARLANVARRQWVPLLLSGVMIYCALFVATQRRWDSGDAVPGAWLPTLACNAAMVGLAIWLMHIGLREERGQTFSAGVCYIMLWSVLRYFDLFSDFGGVLGAAALFLLCGVTLFGLAAWWGRRKEASHV
jgi:hypothetical protein